MSNTPLTWQTIDRVAGSLGAKEWALKKWRQRGVPLMWQIKISNALHQEGMSVALPMYPITEKAA